MRRDGGSARFLFAYGLANAGGVVAYAPLLSLLLPARLAQMAGAARVEWLSAATLLGALTASAAGVLFGWLSDLGNTRRCWVAAGLVATLLSYGLLGWVSTPAGLVAAIVLFQAAANMLLSPLAAWAADVVPDDRKGVLGGLIGAGSPVGALAGVVATLSVLPGEGARLAVVCAIMTVLTLPLLATAAVPARQVPPTPPARTTSEPALARRDLALLWLARLLVQIAAVELFAFLFFYFQALPDAPSQSWVARLIAVTMVLGLPLTLVAGRASDRLGPRRPFLAGAAATMMAGLATMAVADMRSVASVGYLLFGCGLSMFLPLQATFAMQLLPRPDRHGRDLGILNLANTLPSVVAVLLTAGLVPLYGYSALLWTLAAAAALAGGCVLLVRCDRQAT